MANKKDIELVLDLLHQNRPTQSYENLTKNEMGIMGVIKFLHDSGDEVKSKDISDYLKVSSARMAVILKKLELKDLIKKSTSVTDARVTVVKLSTKGKMLASSTEMRLQKSAENLIDEFGMDYLLTLLKDMNKFKNIMEKNMRNSEEILYG
ncbi:MAG: MarR family winged helix-turn-helix transcriptional regulator [Clostridia bacterium]